MREGGGASSSPRTSSVGSLQSAHDRAGLLICCGVARAGVHMCRGNDMTQYGLVASRRALTIVYTLQALPSTPVKPTHMGSWRWIPSVFRRWSFMSVQMASTLLKSSYLTRKVNCIWRGLLKLTITFVLAMRDSLLMICSDNTCQPKHQSVTFVLPLLSEASCEQMSSCCRC